MAVLMAAMMAAMMAAGSTRWSARSLSGIGTSGYLITDSGERVMLYRLLLKLIGRDEPLKVGDRVQFWASKRITYEVRDIGTIVPEEPNAKALKRLRALHRAMEKQFNRDHELDLPVEELAGSIVSFDPEKGYGFIRCEGGELVLLHVTCLRASGYKSAAVGSAVHIEAMERDKGWMAYRILSMDEPPGHSQ